MDQLKEAVDNLKQGKASIFSIVGDAGTGKSRLIEEFRKSLDTNESSGERAIPMPTPRTSPISRSSISLPVPGRSRREILRTR